MPSTSFRKSTKGAAGVHLVVAQLSLNGYVALPTTRNLKSVDAVAFNETLTQFAFLQVKTTDSPKGGWPVHTIRKDDDWQEEIRQAIARSRRFFYVFVSLPIQSRPHTADPDYFIVPCKDVAEMIIRDVTQWLNAKPGRSAARQLCAWEYGGPRSQVVKKYRNKWELLGLG